MSKRSSSKEAVLVITVGFVVLYLLHKTQLYLTLALLFGGLGILSSRISEGIDWCWQRLSLYLGKVSNTLLLTLIFFLVLTPMGLVRRWLGKKGMMSRDQEKKSNFTDRDHVFTRKDLENTW